MPTTDKSEKMKDKSKRKETFIVYGGIALCLLFCAIPAILLIGYKVSYTKIFILPLTVDEFGDYMILLQAGILFLFGLPLINDIAWGKRWYNKILVYLCSIVAALVIGVAIIESVKFWF